MIPPLAFPGRVAIAVDLVPFDDVKVHLRITDDLHDDEIMAAYGAAQDVLIAFLAAAADPAWTEVTVPRPVKHAILLLTTHYYEHRGDDMSPTDSGSTSSAAVWSDVRELVAPYRDPTIA